MATYNYKREIDDTGHWNIDNVKYIVGDDNMEHLTEDLGKILPSVQFNLRCDGSNVEIITDKELSGEQETALTNEIATYKSQTGE